jgi:phosphate transport system substrate-binding protein
MSEPKPKTPKPLSPTAYVIITTCLAFAISGMVVNIPLVLLIALHGLGIIVAAGYVVILYCCFKMLKGLTANLRAGQIPKSFTLRILPFWLPLFWELVVTAACLYAAASLSAYNYYRSIFWGSPQYLDVYIAAVFSGDLNFFIIVSCIINVLLALGGTVYVALLAPPAPKTRGLILYTIITLLLGGLVGLSYNHFRAEFLSPYDRYGVVQDEERNRHDHFGRDTDLSEYIPFKGNNKLVKIKSPTLLIESEYPKLHGAFALYPIYAAAVEATYRYTATIDFDSRHSSGGQVRSGTSPEAFDSLLANRSEMVFMLRPSEKQLQEAKNKGCELVITPIGYEAFVFFVSRVNPVDDLSLDQIRNIYSKKVTRWEQVGGKRERILPFQHPEGSGSQTAMLRMMGDVPMAPPQKEEFRPGMGAIVADVADYRNYGNAIGFSFRYYVEGLFKHDGVKLLSIGGVAPSMANIQDRSYPLIGELVIISRSDNTNVNVQKLTDWFLSPQGQELIKNVGYVPLE